MKASFETYVHPLQGVSSSIHWNHFKFDAKGFEDAAESRDFFQNFHGALGVGFVRRVETKNLNAYLQSQKLINPSFALKRLSAPQLQ